MPHVIARSISDEAIFSFMKLLIAKETQKKWHFYFLCVMPEISSRASLVVHRKIPANRLRE